MGLTTQLTASLDSSHLGAELLGALGGPAGKLSAVQMPASGDRLQSATAGTASIDPSTFTTALANVAQRALPIAGAIPGGTAILGSLHDVVTRLEDLAHNDVVAQINKLLDDLKKEMQSPPDGGRLPLVIHLLDIVSGAGEGKVLRDVLALLQQRAGVELPKIAGYVDGLKAIDGVVHALGGMMSLESVLSEAERLSGAIASAQTPRALLDGLSALDAALRGDGTSLAQFVTGVDATDAAAVSAAVNAVADVAARFDVLQEQFAAALGMGEATLVYLDINRLQSEIDDARAVVRTADLEPLRRLVAGLAPILKPFVGLDLSGLPPGQLGALLTRVEGQIASIAASIEAVDPAAIVKPLVDVIDTLTAPLREANRLVTAATMALRNALEQVRAAVAALPFQEAAEALRTFLAPITQAIEAIRALVHDIDAALHAAADASTAALNNIDAALTAFKSKVDELFGKAQKAVDDANLDKVLGDVAQKVQEFANLLGQAQMQPYFDAAVGAINGAADVVGALPLGLLPDSAKADLDNAVAPIRNTDADAAKTKIKNVLQITPDGKFAARGDLEHAIADVVAKYHALLQVVRDHDPQKLLHDVDMQLQELAGKVRQLSPELTLQPVADAIATVKHAIEGIDLDHALQPVRDVFTQIDAALDRYSPGNLVAPLEQRITQVRSQLVDAIHLAKWSQTLDDLQTRALALVDMAAPERVRPLLDGVLGELVALLDQFPEADTTRGFGTAIAAILGTTGLRIYPTSFPVVAGWIGGSSGQDALSAHTSAIASAFAAAKDAVEKMDLQTVSAPILEQMAALRTAVQGLIPRVDEPDKGRLTVLLPRLDATARFATLSQNRARYLAELTTAAGLADGFKRGGFSEVDATLVTFRQALEPLGPAWQQLQKLMAALGIDPQHLSITGIVKALLAEASPERLANMLMPLFVAFRGRVQALIGAVITPLKGAINELTTLINAIDLKPLSDAADGAVKEVKEQIHRLSPDTLLKEPLQAFAKLKNDLLHDDPLAAITTILTNLRELIARVLDRLSLEKLLEIPLGIYHHILDLLEKIDPQALAEPLFNQLDNLAQQAGAGLDATIEAFKHLQQALPAPGSGGSASASATLRVA